MDKKNYIKPEMAVLEFDSKVLMSVNSIGFGDDAIVAEETDQLVRGRRGKWGDLWYESN